MSEAQESNPPGWRQTPSKTLGTDFNHEAARPSRGLSMATFASDNGVQVTMARPRGRLLGLGHGGPQEQRP